MSVDLRHCSEMLIERKALGRIATRSTKRLVLSMIDHPVHGLLWFGAQAHLPHPYLQD